MANSKQPVQSGAKGTVAVANEAVVNATETVQKHVIDPVKDAIAPKQPRHIRAEKNGKPKATAPLPQRSTKAGGKMMSKSMKLPPKAKPAAGPKPGKQTNEKVPK